MDGASGFNGFLNSNTNAGGNANTNDGGANGNGNHNLPSPQQPCSIREQDRFMPIANVIRIMRKVLPSHAKISDDAKETIQECVSEYISFITSEANDRCQREQRKTITAEDVLWAMGKLGFDNYVDPLTLFLHRYRELEGDHRGSIRGDPLPLLFKHRSPSNGNLVSSGSPSVSLPPPPTMPLMPMGTGTEGMMMVPPMGMGWDQHQHHQHYHHHQFPPMMGGHYYGMYGGNGAAGDGSNGAVSSGQQQSLEYPYSANYK